MWLISQWWKRRRRVRQAMEMQAERRALCEARDNHQTQILRQTLDMLHRTMDPEIATKIYNNRFCPLTRLPEELLVQIIGFLGDDNVALRCLRITSRTFLRLLIKSPGLKGGDDDFQFRRALQRQGRCDNCKLWNDRNSGCLPRHSRDPCKFGQIFEFSGERAGLPRKCLARLGHLGSVQLCEHIHISWASIQAHIESQKQQHFDANGKIDWRACVNGFLVECHDTSHDTRCTNSETPTWPRATLDLDMCRLNMHIRLKLEWKPHCRVDALGPTGDGRIPAPALRQLFRTLRRIGPVDLLCPGSRYPDAMPEMGCLKFSETSSPQAYYEIIEAGDAAPLFNPSVLDWFDMHFDDGHRLFSCYGMGSLGREVSMEPHYLPHASPTASDITSRCLAVHYKKDITIGYTPDMTHRDAKLLPSHPWLHAMDVRTYPHPEKPKFSKRPCRPLCKDESCTNYYLRAETYCWEAAGPSVCLHG